jgi:peroxiredoxin
MFRRSKAARQQGATTPASALEPGTVAPDFALPNQAGELISPQDFRGRPVVLVFYPADWSPVCGDQLTLYNEVLPLFEEHDAQVLAISVDGKWSHRAFAEQRNLRFPLLTDFEPKGAVSRQYGVYEKENGLAQRALFVVDAAGIIRWSYVSPSGVNPGANGILNALEELQREQGT